MSKRLWSLTAVLLILVAAWSVAAQDMMDMEPMVAVSDQLSLDGMVTIDAAVSAGPGFIVIHADNGGAPGPVIGNRSINDGMSVNVSVPIDATMATPVLYAMLHTDTGEVGVYEFGIVDGADGPVADADGNVITPAFNAEVVRAYDQFADGSVTIAAVATAQDGFVVVHSGVDGAPGPVLGAAFVSAGTTTDVTVELEGDITANLWPMLHVDTGEAGVYEFGTVDGADGPVIVDGAVATFPITVGNPAMRVADQIVTDTVMAESVLSEGPGFLVIHADNDGAPGPVIGFAQVEDGMNVNVMAEVDPAGVTPVLWPMLHVDTGEAGVYEFGQVEGADGPVMVDGNVLVFPINAASSIEYSGSISGSTVTVDSALIDASGWMVIHADNNGAPGPVLGQTPLVAGLNTGISVDLMGDITETVFPMLHYDTGAAGVYEFGTVDGADGPVSVGGAVVTGPMTPEAGM